MSVILQLFISNLHKINKLLTYLYFTGTLTGVGKNEGAYVGNNNVLDDFITSLHKEFQYTFTH